MSTTNLALIIAALMVVGLLGGLAALSLIIGAVERYFGKPKLTILKSLKGKTGFAFDFTWNEAKEPAKYELVKLKLFNPFGDPAQLEIARSFDPIDESFAKDLDLGPEFREFMGAKGFDKAQVEIELVSKDGVSYLSQMRGTNFLKLIENAKLSIADIEFEKDEQAPTGPNTKAFGVIPRDNIADTVPGKGPVVAVPTNPAFAQFFGSPSEGGGASSGETQENFAVSKVWIIDGCIICNACEDIYPEVFDVQADTCYIRPEYPKDDGLKVQEAAEACPVEVIKYDVA